MVQDITLGNRYAGYVKNGVFVVRRTKAEHLFVIFQGLGFNKQLIDQFTERGIVLSVAVQYFDGEKEKVLTTTPLHIALVAGEWHNAKDLRDIQYILPLNEFDEKESLQEALNVEEN